MEAADLQVIDGATAGAWIEPRLRGESGTVTDQVPDGFEAYARIFHPASDSVGNRVTWAEVAKACGTTVHGEMQWHAIVGLPEYGNFQNSKWAGQEPPVGAMDISILDALCDVLAAHTTDPVHCTFGLCTIQSWEESFSKDELRGHSLLKLPWGRDHIVLAGPLSAVDQIIEVWSTFSVFSFRLAPGEEGSEPLSQQEMIEWEKPRGSPNLIWPADRSWFVVSEVDFDSTLVGGSKDLIEAIVVSPALEAWRVEPTTSLVEGADKINAQSDD